jgi:hypothetical protein
VTVDFDVSPVTGAAREIASGIWWIPACQRVDIGSGLVHIHNAPYVILGSEKTLMWDTGPPSNWTGVELELDRLLGSRPLDYVVPSHPESPHCGNLRRLFAKYPGLKVLGDVRDYHLYFPDDTDRFVALEPGSEVDLGGVQPIVLLRALVKDLPSSQWAYAPSQQVLFTADAFAYSHHPPLEDDDRPVHLPDECGLLASELSGKPHPEQIVWIVGFALVWMPFLQLDTYRDAFEELLASYPTRIVAPAHGAVIDDMSFVSLIWKTLNGTFNPGTPVAPATLTSREDR